MRGKIGGIGLIYLFAATVPAHSQNAFLSKD